MSKSIKLNKLKIIDQNLEIENEGEKPVKAEDVGHWTMYTVKNDSEVRNSFKKEVLATLLEIDPIINQPEVTKKFLTIFIKLLKHPQIIEIIKEINGLEFAKRPPETEKIIQEVIQENEKEKIFEFSKPQVEDLLEGENQNAG